MASRVSWQYDHTTESWLRWLRRMAAGAVGGVYALLAAMFLGSLLGVLVAGSADLILLVVVFALVGGPFSLLYLLPMFADETQRPSFGGSERQLPTRERIGSAVAGTLVLGGAWLVTPLLAGVVLACGLAAGFLALVCSTRGTIDATAATVETNYREWDLSRVRGYRRRRVGPLAVFTFDATGPGRFGAVPTLLTVPASVAGDVADVLNTVIETTDTETREPNTAVRLVAGSFALLFGGLGIAAPLAVGRYGWYLAVIGVFFGALFLLVARDG